MTRSAPQPARRRTRRLLAGGAGLAVVAAGAVLALPALAAEAGTLVEGEAPSDAVGTVEYTAYLPAGYDETDAEYPTMYLLHGRGDTQAAWQTVTGDLDEMIASGEIQPMVVVMPDAPWSERASWYVDSEFAGSAHVEPGAAVETALAQDLVAHVDATYRTVEDRQARAVGGYSMGGAGALRYAVAHQDTFSAGIVLSPAVYVPQPPDDSSVRDYGAFGVRHKLYDKHRYDELNYPAAFDALDPALPVHLFIAVGDDEWANPDPADAGHDLDLEAAKLYNAARRVEGITAELRILDGGHDWDVWGPAFSEAIVDVSRRLRTEPLAPWEAELVGTSGDDRAGGILPMDDGGTVLGINVAAAYGDVTSSDGLDVVLERRDADGAVSWRHPIATSANDRAYGVVQGADGAVITAGYTRGDLDGAHPSGASDDAFVAAVDASGQRLWTTQFGVDAAADRIYAVASDGAGGAYLAGYTSGALPGGTSSGDKDAVIAHVDAAGQVAWTHQLGSTGEDKALAVALAPDGGVYAGGVSGSVMPGEQSAGGFDGWVAHLTPGGTRDWVEQLGTTASDQVTGLATTADGAVAAAGHTGALLPGAENAAGENDAFVRLLGVDGATRWTRQVGTPTDDRGVAVVARSDGSLVLVGTTYGALGEAVGGVDVFTARMDAAGTLGEVRQLGSVERDGADEWDEANLFAATGADGSLLLSGLTFGAPAGATNRGAGDVFVSGPAARSN